MSKQVVGVYESEEAVVTAVQQLQSRGYETEEISVITNHDHYTDSVETITGASVDNVTEEHRHESFFDKLKHAFNNEDHNRSHNNLGERLSDYGIPPSEASSYANDVEAGKILLVVDSEQNLDAVNGASPVDKPQHEYGTFRIMDEPDPHREHHQEDTFGTHHEEKALRRQEEQHEIDRERQREFRTEADHFTNEDRSLRSDDDLMVDRDPDRDLLQDEDKELRDRTRRTPRNLDDHRLF